MCPWVCVCDMCMVQAFEYRVCMPVYTHAEARGGCMLGIFYQSLFYWLGTRSLFKSETYYFGKAASSWASRIHLSLSHRDKVPAHIAILTFCLGAGDSISPPILTQQVSILIYWAISSSHLAHLSLNPNFMLLVNKNTLDFIGYFCGLKI